LLSFFFSLLFFDIVLAILPRRKWVFAMGLLQPLYCSMDVIFLAIGAPALEKKTCI